MDVDTAFLNAPIKEDIWVRMPKGTPLASNDDGIYKLQKSLYGLKQAPREWNNHINEFLITSGFQRMEADSCIYIRPQWDEAAQCNKYSVAALYVDDLIIAFSNIHMCKKLEREFKKKYHMKILGEIKHILGMDVEINSYQWVDEDLVTFADPLMSLNKSNRGKVAVQPKEMDKKYFDPLVSTRHTNPDNGPVYETTKVKIDRQGYIVTYRRLQILKVTQSWIYTDSVRL
jgi:Reverse transcriptase (RNA-dependent DNA polymerase)